MKKFLRDVLDDTNYTAPVGCWNCDIVYNIKVKKGLNVPEHLMKAKLPCRTCGCDTLKPKMEYENEKAIMKDLVLHHRIQSLEEKETKEVDKNNTHFR